MNKCPNCGNEYGEFDIYCSKCGYKIESLQELERIKEALEKTESLETFMEEDSLKNKEKKEEKKERSLEHRSNEYFTIEKKSFFNSTMFNFISYMTIVFIFMVVALFVIISNQTTRRDVLQFKNLMNNPMQIPELKESQDYVQLGKNFYNVEKFLSIYLKYSKDSQFTKEQIFANYLNEINKLPHITSENMYSDEIKECKGINSLFKAQSCTKRLNHLYKNTSIKAYNNYTTVYLYPDYRFIKKNYSKYLSDDFKNYLALNAKYDKPSVLGLNLKISPKKLANKIYEYETLFNKTTNSYIRESLQNSLYYDFRSFIFNPIIYATTTQEMTQEFKGAYLFYINSKKTSLLVPVVMSYMDKQRSYSEENFKNDYPYKLYEESFDKNIQNSTFTDVFAQLRKSIAQSGQLEFEYVYSFQTGRFERYSRQKPISTSNFVLSNPDESNNVSIYTNTYSPFQELNIQRNSQLYLISGSLYVFNKGRLSISKIVFNGKIFTTQTLSNSDIFSLFPGVEIINLDSQSNYNILLEKPNMTATYIVLSKYSQGFEDYKFDTLQGKITSSILPNMFSISSNTDTIISFHSININPEETSDSAPTYKFIIRTKGSSQNSTDSGITSYDAQTAIDETSRNEKTRANIMPKIENIEPKENSQALQMSAPTQRLEPPVDDND